VAILVLAAGLGGVLASASRASLHHPEGTTAAVPVNEKGEPEALSFDDLKRRRLVLRNASNPEWPLVAIDPQTKQPVIDPKTGQPSLSDRGRVDARIKKEMAKRPELRTPEEKVALAVDLLQFGRADDAEGALTGLRTGFLPNITLAHIAIAQDSRDRPGWARAYDYLDIANGERPPTNIPGTPAPKLAWQLKVNRGPLLKLVHLRLSEARGAKRAVEDELPDRIFDVNFVNAAGEYEPGVLAPAEAAKLPPDALAVVQQLVLWFPNDIRLYWLLGELYAVKGDFKAAQDIMDECVNSGRFSNRKVLIKHREAIARAAKAKGPAADEPLLGPPSQAPPPEEQPAPPAVPFSFGAVWIYFGVVVLFGLLALVRAILRRRDRTA